MSEAALARSDLRLVSSLRSLARIGSIAVGLLGGTVLLGWVLNSATLKSINPAWAAMVPGTATAFILLGISLWLLHSDQPAGLGSVRRGAGRTCALVAGLLGGVHLAEYLFSLNLGIDRALFGEALSTTGTSESGRMAPHTAMNFVFLGSALLFLDWEARGGRRPAQYLALAGLLVGLLTMIGYVYGVASLIGTMAIHTTVAFIILSAGILFARPERGLMATATSDSAGGSMVRRLSLAVIGIPMLIGWLVLQGQRAERFDLAFGISLFALLVIVAFAVLVLANAGPLHRMDVERKRAKEFSDALNSINAAITSTLDFDQIMQRVVVESAKAMGVESTAIFLSEDDVWTLRYAYGLSGEPAGKPFSSEQARALTLAAKAGEPLVVGDAAGDSRIDPELVRRLGARSLLAVPLLARKEVIGSLFFHYHSAAVPFNQAQVDFALKLAASVSLALENARLYAGKRDIADTLQEALLTMPEKISGIDFGCLYHSATESAEVGGDFYDLFELEHERVGIIVGDVSGKGLSAATLTSLVKNTLKAYSYQEDSPAAVVAKANYVLNKNPTESVFVTVFLGMLDTRSGLITYCSAGHPPALLRRKTSKASFLETGSPVIGAFADFEYLDHREPVEAGDLLLLYSDGVTEARCEDGFFGEERLLGLIESRRATPAKEIPKMVFDEAMACTGGRLTDDVVLLAISLKEAA